MDSNMYNYASGNVWNGYNEGFQPPPLDLQSYMPAGRDNYSREQNKNPLVPSAPPYVFFNYPEESPHTHHHHHHHLHHNHQHHHHSNENMNRNQWHFSSWSKVKSRPEPGVQAVAKRQVEKQQFHKDTDMRQPSVDQAGSSHLNIPPLGGFCTPDSSDRPMENVQRVNAVLNPQENLTHIPSVTAHTNDFPNLQTNNVLRNVVGKKQAPRKRREKPKKEGQPVKKRSRDEEKWARNIRKKARAKGESYISVQGKTVPARTVKPVDCSKCKFNCPSRVSEEDRLNLFKNYWGLETFKEKVDFISNCVNEFAPLRPVSGRRAYSRRYMLKVNGKDERVCKEFFVTTFDISESTIVTYMSKKRKGPDAVADMRGKQTPRNKTPESTVRSIREHILSQIGLQGEFTKSPSEEMKNVKRLYRHYQAECEMEEVKPTSISVYRKVYSHMHKDKSDAPVELPPEDILMQNSKKKSKSEKTGSKSATSAKEEEEEEEEEAAPLEHSSSPEASESCDSLPHDSDMVAASNSSALTETASPYELGLMPNVFHASGQHMPPDPLSDKRMCALNIPHTVHQLQQQHHQQLHPPQQQQQQLGKSVYGSSYQANASNGDLDRGHINSILPFMWDSNPIGNNSATADQNLGYSSAPYSNQNHLIQPPSSALSSTLFNYRISSSMSSASSSSSTTVPIPPASTSAMGTGLKPYQGNFTENVDTKKSSKKSGTSRSRKAKENKPKKEAKKRTRNEELWGRNVRKRLRFKGEAYTSVRGKLVEAKRVKEVDCSKCKFKCTSRITDEQRETLNMDYWNLDTYKKKIEFLTKYVETYTPKRKMTGRRAFSRKYVFDINSNEVRVCKDFFKATLHISESTIATALDKSRKGPDAIVDMRGKHKPVNKTTEETLQNIRELIIYLTGMRPHRTSNNTRLGSEYKDVNRLYQVYKYDSEKKGKKVASLGIFRSVLIKEFCIKATKPKKRESSESSQSINNAVNTLSTSSSQSWSINTSPTANSKIQTPALVELLPRAGTMDIPQYSELSLSS